MGLLKTKIINTILVVAFKQVRLSPPWPGFLHSPGGSYVYWWGCFAPLLQVAALDTHKKISGRSKLNPWRTGPPGPPTWPRTPGQKRPSLVAVLESGAPPESPPFVFTSIRHKPTEGMPTRDTDLAASMLSTPLRPEIYFCRPTCEGFRSLSPNCDSICC
jgi:hypothetical protein